MLKKFFKESGSIIGYLFGIIGTAVTIYCAPGSITIAVRWLVIIGFVMLALIVIAIKATINYGQITKNGTRFLITAYDNSEGKDCYYTEYTDNLRIGTLVSVYYSKPMSKIVGYGVVTNSSTNEYVEVEIYQIESTMQSIFEQSKTNNQKVLHDTYILPNVYISKIPEIAKQMEGGKNNG